MTSLSQHAISKLEPWFRTLRNWLCQLNMQGYQLLPDVETALTTATAWWEFKITSGSVYEITDEDFVLPCIMLLLALEYQVRQKPHPKFPNSPLRTVQYFRDFCVNENLPL